MHMKLYHGSNVAVEQPRLLTQQRRLDFGPGFYTTTDFEQAASWARRTARIRRVGSALVTAFTLDEEAFEKLRILRFATPTEEWLRFVAANRKAPTANDNWDAVAGPVANDQTMPTLTLYLDGFLNEQEAIARLLPQNLKDQIAFKTPASLECLTPCEVMRA